jgi:hypothetical protein
MRSHLESSNPRLAEAQAGMRARIAHADEPRVDESLRPYSVPDLMTLHGLSRQSVIRLYEHEPDVEILPRPGGCTGRRCRTIRVPRHVYVRVRNKMRVR